LSIDRVVQKDKPAIVLPTHIHTVQHKKEKNYMDKTKNNTKTINLKIHKNTYQKWRAARNKVDFLTCRMV